MALLQLINTVLFFTAFIVVFISWKWALLLIILTVIIHAIPYGPNHVFRIVTGLLFSGGLVYLFINWRIGIVLLIGSFLVGKFWAWSVKVNDNYYNGTLEEAHTEEEERGKKSFLKKIIGAAFILFAVKPLLVSIEEAGLAYGTYGSWEYNHLLIGLGALVLSVWSAYLGYSFIRQTHPKERA